ncbi:hypothetical protein TPAR_06236 [Tolypocladium paradoxum]|uniref:Uncharacterized protein n=1 Tax=Tolypocladium paradoxum TaxID=94208 RepID=A0A2S4KTN8_9HYPO|nr:hypothetical protein TPAR_06236 [Tolypocladium paradoxum]
MTLLVQALHDAAEQPAAADAADDGIDVAHRAPRAVAADAVAVAARPGRDGVVPRHVANLPRNLAAYARVAVPDVGRIKRRDVDGRLAPGARLRHDRPREVAVRLVPRRPALHHVGRARLPQLGDDEGRRRQRHHDGGPAAQRDGRVDAGEARVAARGAVEVRLRVRAAGVAQLLEPGGHEVADAARLEGPRGLQVFQLEEDIASRRLALAERPGLGVAARHGTDGRTSQLRRRAWQTLREAFRSTGLWRRRPSFLARAACDGWVKLR